MEAQWDTQFERESPTKDKVTQINIEIEEKTKPIFISENLTLSEKEDLLVLIRECIDVFTWNYEDMPCLDPKVTVHQLNVMLGAKPVK